MRFSRGHNAVATAAALAIVFGVGWAAAQEPGEELTAMFYEPLKVRLVNVHVVATDSNGVPIRGLTESDFEIFEDGQPVEISHFLAADSQAGGVVDDEARTTLDEALQPNVHMALYFDDYNVNPRHRTSVLNHLRGFLDRPLPEGVKVILVRFDGQIHIESDFSDDRGQLLSALDRIQSQNPIDLTREGEVLVRRMQNAAPKAHITVGGSGSANVDSGSRNGDPAGVMAVMQADFMPELHAYAGAKFIRNRSSADALTTFVRYMQGIPGRKAVLWVGGLETRVGENLFRTYVELFPTHAKSQSLNPMMDSLQYDITQNLRTLVQYANSHRVSFYTLGSLGIGISFPTPSNVPRILTPDPPQEPPFETSASSSAPHPRITSGISPGTGPRESLQPRLPRFRTHLNQGLTLLEGEPKLRH